MQQPLDLTQILATLRRLLPTLAHQYRVQSLGVFGSYARHAQRRGRDLDVLVTCDSPSRGGTPTLASRTRHPSARRGSLGVGGACAALAGSRGAGGGTAKGVAVARVGTWPGIRPTPRMARGACAAAQRWRAPSRAAPSRAWGCHVSIGPLVAA
jgi:Nucleotidyltransferase domain